MSLFLNRFALLTFHLTSAYTGCSSGEFNKFVLLSWAWQVRGSSGGWQNFNDTWTFDYILQLIIFTLTFFWRYLNFKMLTFYKYTLKISNIYSLYGFCSHFHSFYLLRLFTSHFALFEGELK